MLKLRSWGAPAVIEKYLHLDGYNSIPIEFILELIRFINFCAFFCLLLSGKSRLRREGLCNDNRNKKNLLGKSNFL